MSYYAAAGEPPGQWAGKGAGVLGLAVVVDPEVADRLYSRGIGPGGELLARRPQSKDRRAAEDAAVTAYLKERPYASSVEVAEVRAAQRAKGDARQVPYYDFTVTAVKSVSVLHASLRVAAEQARTAGAVDRAGVLDRRADDIERALMDAARESVAWLEANAAFTRTGYHSSTTGEWRDGDGLTSSLFLHHISRDGDPHLHVHIAVLNLVQRGDKADEKWRTLYGRALFEQRLGLWPVPDRLLESRLRGLGYVMVPRADGNGCEVGGVSQEVMDRFSSRAVAVTGELERLAEEWSAAHGGAVPSQRTLWLLHQQAGQRTRRAKSEARRTVNGQVRAAEPTERERLAAWEAQNTAEETRVLSAEYEAADRFARDAAQGGTESARGVPDGAEARAARVAVAEVQKHHAAWSWAQLRFECHRALGAGASEADVAGVADLAVSGRADTGAVQVGAAPDPVDVTTLGVRASDGVSVYRPPGERRWTTLAHLDIEARIISGARREAPQMVSLADAKAAVAETGLNPEQAAAVVAMLTARTETVVLDAAAGAGKTYALAVFARLWMRFTGRRVIGLATSENAARVMEGEGLGEAYNIAEFLGKNKDTQELRRPVPVHAGDVLILDEATQVSTADMAMVQEAAGRAGAWLHLVGDTRQLGAVDAGGMFALLASEVGSARLEEIRRFRYQWERDASVRLREGDPAVVAVYDRRGRVRGGDREAVFGQAAGAWLGDHLRGRDVVLLAGSNEEAADLARRVQGRLAEMGRVGPGVAELADGNRAGAGDLIRARLNADLDAGGRRLVNRDRLRVEGFVAAGDLHPPVPGVTVTGAEDEVRVRRQEGPGRWSAPFRVPVSYLKASAELDYAGNVHVAQGRTVDAGHLVVTPTLSRQSLYVGMTRGREENTAHVVTGDTAKPGQPALEQQAPEAVLASVMRRDAADLSATETMRRGQEWAGGAGHVLHLWSVAVRESLYPDIDRRVKEQLTPDQAARYDREHAREAFRQRVREAHLAGHDLGELISRVTEGGLGGARSVSSVLHSRLSGLGLGQAGGVTWAGRTPAGAPPVAAELAEALDERGRELGVRAAAGPEPWLARHLGVLTPDASPALRAEYERRAGVAAGYREAAGITGPDADISVEPHAGNPELEAWRRAVMRELEIRDEAEIYGSMSRGDLEAMVTAGGRAVAVAPADVSADLRAAGQAQADAWAQAADARARGDDAQARGAEALAGLMGPETVRLEESMAGYEQWSADTARVREQAGKAGAELARRRQEPAAGEPGSMVEWWRRFEADLAEVDRALAAERQAAEAEGRPWPPQLKTPGPRSEPEADKGPENMPADIPAADITEPAADIPEVEAAGSDTQGGPGHAPPQAESGPPCKEAEAASPGLPESVSPRGAQSDPPPPPAPEAGKPEPAAIEDVDRVVALDARLAELAEAAAGYQAEQARQAEADDYVARTRGPQAGLEAGWSAGVPETEPDAELDL